MKKIYVYLFLLGSVFSNIPCKAMEDENGPRNFVLKRVQGKTIEELQRMEASISYDLLAGTLGNMLDIENEQLKISCPSIDEEKKVLELYNLLNTNITVGIIGERETNLKSAKEQSHQGARCIGKQKLTLISEKSFSGNQAIFGSDGEIKFTSPIFEFQMSFIDVAPLTTTVMFFPPSSFNSPIEYLKFTPKKSPLFIQGKINFRDLSFNDFMVSNSELCIKFKK